MNTPSEVKARANKLRDVLNVMGHQLKHSESLEVISKLEGYTDWNTYTAYLTKKKAEWYSADKNPEADTAVHDHPIIDAIKSDDEALLRESLSREVLGDKSVMAEAFKQSVLLDRVSLAEVLIAQGADIGSVVIRRQSLFGFVIRSGREDYLKMLVLKFKHLKGIHRKNS